MKIENYKAAIARFHESNPDLCLDELAVCLFAELLYRDLPESLSEFRKKYAHMDPSVLAQPHEGITFLRIAEDTRPAPVLRKRLNDYMNLKFHDINTRRTYPENAAIFREKSIIVSGVIEEVLARAAFPEEIVEVLQEKEEVRTCYDFYEMLRLYRRREDLRTRFEILRKIGLIVLIARINRTVLLEELEQRKKEVWQVFDRRLRSGRKGREAYYLWLNGKQKVEFTPSESRARRRYAREMENRRRQVLRVHPLQRFICHPFDTFSGNRILHMEIRNKFGDRGSVSYASYVEKMVRKNLEFPNQVHDTIGVKIVVERENQIQDIIRDLESFLGGSSTRKMQKNSYHRFGRRKISEYSSPGYFVWKAVYDIALPHPSVFQIRKMLQITRQNPVAQRELRSRMRHFQSRPSDFVIEVQLQDIRSYLLSIAGGSPTAHTFLKTNQIRSNSFFKFFPSEIYEGEIRALKLRLLGRVPAANGLTR